MPTSAKVKALHARPLQAGSLCFEVGGILDELPAQLGSGVAAFDLDAFYDTLRAGPTQSDDPSRLVYGSQEIQSFTEKFALATLRAEPTKTGLTQALNARQNAYFAKYANAAAIIAQMQASYSPDVPGSKPDRLARLRSLAVDQGQQLRATYAFDQVLGVVRDTSSTLHTEATSTNSSHELASTEDTRSHVVATTEQESQTNEGSQSDQTIVNTYRAYRTPFFESQAQYERAQISLIDEQFAQFMAGQNLLAQPQHPSPITQVFANELQSIDGDVYQWQVALLNTILLSPIGGTVTGIYRNPGEWVSAGEPIVRVENNAICLLVGTVVCRARIALGSSVTISTQLFDAASPATTQILGTVVAARGQDVDDEWEIVLQCDNLDKAGNAILPLGYEFDYDDTNVSIG